MGRLVEGEIQTHRSRDRGRKGVKEREKGGGGGGGETEKERLRECQSVKEHRLVGLVVKASASRAEGPGFESR